MTLIRNLKTSLRNFMFLCMAILRLHTLCLPLVSQVHPDYFFVFVLHILCMAILRPLTLYFHPIFHFVFVFGYPTPIHPVFTIGFTSSPYLCFLFFLFHNLCTAILRLLTAYFHLFFDLCFVYGFMYMIFSSYVGSLFKNGVQPSVFSSLWYFWENLSNHWNQNCSKSFEIYVEKIKWFA